MTTIIDLLNEKNNHLEKFLSVNEEELDNFSSGCFDNLERFYESREGILAIVAKLDEMIATEQGDGGAVAKINSELQNALSRALDYKNELVIRILELDLLILSVIEVKKSDLIKEISQVRSARKVIGSYRSQSPEARIDEEA